MAELVDTSEALIHDVYGYASQALINLMLTGRAVAHVWDNVQDVGGLGKCLLWQCNNSESISSFF